MYVCEIQGAMRDNSNVLSQSSICEQFRACTGDGVPDPLVRFIRVSAPPCRDDVSMNIVVTIAANVPILCRTQHWVFSAAYRDLVRFIWRNMKCEAHDERSILCTRGFTVPA